MIRSSLARFTRFRSRRRFSDDNNNEKKEAYLRQANAQMARYHETRELLRQGKLPPNPENAKYSQQQGSADVGYLQGGVVLVLLLGLIVQPYLNKRMLRDPEFKEQYGPYLQLFNFQTTLGRTDHLKPWTREELHEQRIAVERDLRERAIRGDFANPQAAAEADVPEAWRKIHPGMDQDEEWNEE